MDSVIVVVSVFAAGLVAALTGTVWQLLDQRDDVARGGRKFRADKLLRNLGLTAMVLSLFPSFAFTNIASYFF